MSDWYQMHCPLVVAVDTGVQIWEMSTGDGGQLLVSLHRTHQVLQQHRLHPSPATGCTTSGQDSCARIAADFQHQLRRRSEWDDHAASQVRAIGYFNGLIYIFLSAFADGSVLIHAVAVTRSSGSMHECGGAADCPTQFNQLQYAGGGVVQW